MVAEELGYTKSFSAGTYFNCNYAVEMGEAQLVSTLPLHAAIILFLFLLFSIF